MNGRGRTIAAVALGLFFAVSAAADTLELKDGRVLQGRYLGGTQAVLRFEVKGEVQTFNVADAVALTFTGNSGTTSAPIPTSSPASAPSVPPAPDNPPQGAPDVAPPPDDSQPPVTSQDVPPPAAPTPASSMAAAPAPGVAPAASAAKVQDPAAQYGEIT